MSRLSISSAVVIGRLSGQTRPQHALERLGAPSPNTSARRSTRGHSARGLSRIVVSAIDSGAGIGRGLGAANLAVHGVDAGMLGDVAVLRRQLERGVVVR